MEIDPNSFKLIEIPVSVLAEISGTVYKETAKGNKPQERILINIYNSQGTRVAQTLSEADGYFSYLRLAPGSYLIKPDAEQMRILGLHFSPEGWHFEIAPTYYGDVLRDINFTLTETDVKKKVVFSFKKKRVCLTKLLRLCVHFFTQRRSLS